MIKHKLLIVLAGTVLAVTTLFCSCGKDKEKDNTNNVNGDGSSISQNTPSQEDSDRQNQLDRENRERMTDDEICVMLGDRPDDLDPSSFTAEPDKYRLTSLIFEGLTGIDENGAVYPLGATSWKSFRNSDGNTVLEIYLRETFWSNGSHVTADDYVYTFKKIAAAGASNPAFALIAPINNAKRIKSGYTETLGVYAASESVLDIVFEDGFTDTEYFLQCLASPALVPIPSFINDETDWTNDLGKIVTNGPFTVTSISENRLILDRNVNYKNAQIARPERIYVHFGDEGSAIKDLGSKYHYIEDLSADALSTLSGKTVSRNKPVVYTYYFNTKSPELSDANTRKALSAALDREKIASIHSGGVKKATGFVPHSVYDLSAKKQFASSEDVLADSLEGSYACSAKKLRLYCNEQNEYEKAIAEYAKSQWSSLGVIVEIFPVSAKELVRRTQNGDYDIIALETFCPTYDALGMLAPFALEYSGAYVDVTNPDVFYNPHFTGYNSEKYNELTEKALHSKGAERSDLLHNMEKMLLEDAVLAPLYFDVNTYASSGLGNVTGDYKGMTKMTEVTLSK